jgi:photosystem II stability/assembly factor-like uncharacterized protein
VLPDFLRRRGFFALTLSALILAFVGHELQAQTPWSAVGPDGGDARSFAAEPGHSDHLYLGTTNSWIYESTDGGGRWRRLAKLDSSDNLILDHIVVDSSNSSTIYVAAWKVDRPDGGLWVSHDKGRTWRVVPGLRGQSIRAFVQAPSNAKILYAGTLEGVFRSPDAGASWTQISPVGSREIHEVESLAIDPIDPDIVYAGTWHLPWKTADGGQKWHNIKRGLIDDSDVFSIIVDPAAPSSVFLSACSGIYKSENGAELFRKIQGIPSTARRTRMLKQDPSNGRVVYAGTTEGLYKTVDGGRTFQRMTGQDVIVNDVFIDPQDTNQVLLATDRGGVLVSKDAGASFAASNGGFSERKVEALLVDRDNPARLYAGVVNDKNYGGVFLSTSAGAEWEQVGEGPGGGLAGRDVFALAEAKDGTIVAGTSHGIFVLQAGAGGGAATWQPRNTIVNTIVKATTETHYGKRVSVERESKGKAYELDSSVSGLDLSSDVWLASTGMGLLTSRDQGATWQGGPAAGLTEYLSVAVHGAVMVGASRTGLAVSTDAGLTWMPVNVPAAISRIYRVAFSDNGTLWVGTREGVYFTPDQGKKWMWFQRLPFRDVNDLYYDAQMKKVLVSSRISDYVYAIDPASLSWRWWRAGWNISLIRATGGRLVAASLYDGVVVERQAGSVVAGHE